MSVHLSAPRNFADLAWDEIPDSPGVYVISTDAEVLYVGMAGRSGSGSLRKRLRDHASGQLVNMFAQYLFLARVQFEAAERVTHPRAAQAACREYVRRRCRVQFAPTASAGEARAHEGALKVLLRPVLNP